MGDIYDSRIEIQCCGLRFRRLLECRRGDHAARNTSLVQIPDVMQTARRTGPSIAERFDHHVAFGGNRLREVRRRCPRVRRLCVLLDRKPFVAQQSRDLVAEDVASHLTDVEHANG